MITTLDCVPCLLRQTLEAARNATDDVAVHERVVHEVLQSLAGSDLSMSPPAVGQQMHRRLRELTGVDDPYREAKDRFNRLALDLLPDLRARVAASPDPFVSALKMAIAGNVIDLGANGGVTEAEAREAVDHAADEPVIGDIDSLRAAVDAAERILYLADNAGEIVFDRLFLEQLPRERITLAVRGRPVLNDVTMVDAETAGITDLVPVIDNGSDAPATILADCSPEFRAHYDAADLIIAKGQGNFESLSEAPGDIAFLFRAKCPAIAEVVNQPIGAHVLVRSHELREMRS